MTSSVVALAGRRIDALHDDYRAFPLDEVDRVSAEIAAYLERAAPIALVSAAACGADLVALRAAGFLGIRRMVVLPYNRDLFLKTSVRDRPGDWDDYDQIISEVVSEAGVEELGFEEPNPAAFRAVNKAIFDRASALAYPVRACVVWEGAAQEGVDYTAEFKEFSQDRGIPVDEISTLFPVPREPGSPRHDFCVSTCSDLLVPGDQQTSDRSFRHCPIFGEVLTPPRQINSHGYAVALLMGVQNDVQMGRGSCRGPQDTLVLTLPKNNLPIRKLSLSFSR